MTKFLTLNLLSMSILLPSASADDDKSLRGIGVGIGRRASLLAEKCPENTQKASLKFVRIDPKFRKHKVEPLSELELVCSTSRGTLFVYAKGKDGEWGFTVYLDSLSKPSSTIMKYLNYYQDKSVKSEKTYGRGNANLNMPIRMLTPGIYKQDVYGSSSEGSFNQKRITFFGNLEKVELAHDLSKFTLQMNEGKYRAEYEITSITNNWGKKKTFVDKNRGGLTQNEILRVIKSDLNGIRECYEIALKKTPELEGSLKIKFVINPLGIVKSAITMSSDPKNLPMENCVLKRIKAWKFPKPENGKDVEVKYPFRFNPI